MSDLAELTFADDAATEYANVVLYGEPGCGKSAAAASAPGPLLWLNLEGRNSTAFARKLLRQSGGSIREVIAAEQAMRTVDLLRLFVAEARTGSYASVVVDTLGALRSALVKEMVAKNTKQSLQQYGAVADEMTAFVLALRDTAANVVFLSHEEEVKSDEGGLLKVRPMIGGKATDDVIKEMDVVAFCTVVPAAEGEPARYMAQYVPGRGRVAKDRSDGLGAFGPSSAGHIIPTFLQALQTPQDAKADEVEAAFREQFDATPAPDPAAEAFLAEQAALDQAPAAEGA